MIFFYLFTIVLSLSLYIGFIFFLVAEVTASFTTDAPFVPVPKEIVDEIIKNLGLTSSSVLYDLGCGDARVLIKTAQKYPGIKAVGVEIAFFPYLLAKLYAQKYKNIEIIRENIFKTDISNATHIFVYLYPKIINRLFLIIKEQSKAGTKIVSCDFQIEGQKPIQIINLSTINPNSKRGQKLFIYTTL